MVVNVKKKPVRLTASSKAVITRLLRFNEIRINNIITRVKKLSEEEATSHYEEVLKNFKTRHRFLEQDFELHYEKTIQNVPHAPAFSFLKKMLTGALFSMEYSIMASALFNPSIVEHPDQSGVPAGSIRFVMSLRATGEGHISSIVFKTGMINRTGDIEMDHDPEFYTALKPDSIEPASDYTLISPGKIPLNESVIFPVSAEECMGMEDARFVKFSDGHVAKYFGTYTAYNGKEIKTKIIETEDFRSFRIRSLQGSSVSDKGMALFPEKVNGKYVIISRQGGEMINIMMSDDLYTWNHHQLLLEPEYIWEIVQLGNCGSPVKTEKGWLLLIHGVGPMRTYVISALLLDLNDPLKITGRLAQPILRAEGEDRDGYVPNVVYTCGCMLHNGLLIIPYAVSDSATGFATVEINDLLNNMISKK